MLQTLLVILSCCYVVYGAEKTAECEIKTDSGVTSEAIHGKISFQQTEGQDLKITIKLIGFNSTDANTEHGFHVHENGLLGNMCKEAGGHYNPTYKVHGGPNDAVRHVGDLGNIQEVNGGVDTTITDTVASLFGDYSILKDRAIVVHATRDDLGKGGVIGSNTTGAAGSRLGCCKIMATTASAAVTYGGSLCLLLAALFLVVDKITH